MKKISITAGSVSATAELNESPTAQAIWNALPIEGSANTWGDEIYFGIPVQLDEAPDAKADVSVGDLAYWSPGNAFCIFFGATPASTGKTPRAASPVNLFGKVTGDAKTFKSVRSGTRIQISRAEK